MLNFKSSLAFRIFNFAIKVEKLSKDSSKMRDIKELEALASLQGTLENSVDLMYEHTEEMELFLRKLQQKEK